MKIIRDVHWHKPYDDKADELFKKAYNELKGSLFRFKRAKDVALLLASEIQYNLTLSNWVVLKSSQKHKDTVTHFWNGVYESIENIKSISK